MILRQREPDFQDFLRVLHREKPNHPVLFEIFMDTEYYEFFTGKTLNLDQPLEILKTVVEAFYNAGYVYASTHASAFSFPTGEHHVAKSISLNEGNVITDRASYEAYQWPDPDAFDDSRLGAIAPFLPEGMKLLVMGPGGVLENVTALVGYDNLCYMIFEDPQLLQDIFDQVGSRLLRYYERALEYDTVGVVLSNDDWGFNTQTFLSVPDMRRFVFPWHKKIAAAAHAKGRPAILHSCGYMADVMDDIIDDMQFDAKHSFEDNILSVEKSYDRWGKRIAILGGLDLDFLIRSTPEEISARAKALLEHTGRGGYALGSGNSLAHYLPQEKVVTMLRAAQD